MQLDWATKEFGGANLADPRQVRSLVRIAAALLARPQASLTSALGPALRQAAHRIMEHPGTSLEGIEAGHYQATALRCGEEKCVLIAQDTTFFVYGQAQITGLAPVNKSKTSKGLIAHSALAMTEGGLPLGLLHLDIGGLDETAPPRRSGERLPLKERESYKWLASLQAVASRLPEKTRAVLIQDREADYFEFLAAERPAQVDLLVRASQDRRVQIEVSAPHGAEAAHEAATVEGSKLFAVAKAAPLLGRLAVKVPRKPGEPERTASLELRARPVWLLRPHGTESRTKRVQIWVVDAQEVNPPEGVKAVHWVLLETRPVATLAEAERSVVQYSRRWLIERLHFTLKSGLRSERLQIDDAVSLAHVLAVYYPVAYRLLQLTYLARENPEGPPEEVLTADELAVLSRVHTKPITNTAEAVLAVAKLGGYEYYRNAPPPGVKVLWMGWAQLRMLVLGWRIGRAEAAERSTMTLD